MLYEFDSGTVDLDKAITIHSFGNDSFIKVGESENGFLCWIETNNGDVVEVPDVMDDEQMSIWLEHTDLILESFLDLVHEYAIWD